MLPAHRAIVRLIVLAPMPFLIGGCTMVAGVPPTAVEPRPAGTERVAAGPGDAEAAATPAASGSTDAAPTAAERITAGVVEVALESIGTPYEWGGTDENGFDCSGLIQFAYARFGVSLPRVSRAQMRAGEPVEPHPTRLRPGDVLGFSQNGTGRTSHVGLYIGDDRFIHSGSNGVTISTLRSPYWQVSLVEARRIVE